MNYKIVLIRLVIVSLFIVILLFGLIEILCGKISKKLIGLLNNISQKNSNKLGYFSS